MALMVLATPFHADLSGPRMLLSMKSHAALNGQVMASSTVDRAEEIQPVTALKISTTMFHPATKNPTMSAMAVLTKFRNQSTLKYRITRMAMTARMATMMTPMGDTAKARFSNIHAVFAMLIATVNPFTARLIPCMALLTTMAVTAKVVSARIKGISHEAFADTKLNMPVSSFRSTFTAGRSEVPMAVCISS